MAHYALGTRGRQVELVAVWQDAGGRYAEILVRLDEASRPALRDIADHLEGLSESLWSSYADETLDVESVALDVADMLGAPEFPLGGYIAAYLDPLHEHCARLARALAGLGDVRVGRAVRAEIDRELAALSRATLGDFSGRAGQATWRNRADASPTQVATAHDVLRRHAEGAESIDGLRCVEPAAACAALVSWCAAAAQVYGELSGRPPVTAARAASDVANLDVDTMGGILRSVFAGRRRPVEVVAELLPSLDGRKLFGSLVFGYFALWELVEQHVQTDACGAPTLGGRTLAHPVGASWAALDQDSDEYLFAWHQAVEIELGRRVSAAVRDGS
jgi:hypothetical protein